METDLVNGGGRHHAQIWPPGARAWPRALTPVWVRIGADAQIRRSGRSNEQTWRRRRGMEVALGVEGG